MTGLRSSGVGRSPGCARRRGLRRVELRVGLALTLALVSWTARLSSAPAAPIDDERRARTGVRLFRALLAADTELSEKTLDDGSLLVVVYCEREADRCEELAAPLESDDAASIRGMPVAVEIVEDPTFPGLAERRPAGIFLADAPTGRGLQQIVRYGVEHRVIVYSPFEGHVESGVLAGLSIEAQVRPYINSETLDASGISLKPFFLKVAKVYP